jgi:hypothetical protein
MPPPLSPSNQALGVHRGQAGVNHRQHHAKTPELSKVDVEHASVVAALAKIKAQARAAPPRRAVNRAHAGPNPQRTGQMVHMSRALA